MSVQEDEYCGFRTAIEEPGILVVTFNRPESLNAATAPMKRDLVEILTQTQMDDAIRIVLFTGEGSAFWAGDDLKGYGGDSKQVPEINHGHHNPSGTYNGLRAISQAVNTTVRNLDKISIAAINGFAIQTGFSLALACDFRVASQSAKMGSATLRFGLLIFVSRRNPRKWGALRSGSACCLMKVDNGCWCSISEWRKPWTS